MPPNASVEINGGRTARLQYAILRSATLASRPLGHRGLHRLVRMVGRYFPEDNTVSFPHGCGRISVRLFDGYWMPYHLTASAYEPEVGIMLDCMLDEDVLFVDCGANIGYWTLYASSRTASVIPVEPTLETYEQLKNNIAINGLDLEPLLAAVSERSEETACLSVVREHHESSRVVSEFDAVERMGPPAQGETVVTVTVDDIVSQRGASASRTLIKLDVEGSEVRALAGAMGTLMGGAVVVYEEHGSDSACSATRFLSQQADGGDFLLFFVLETGELLSIKDPSELLRMKSNPFRGYTLIAGRRSSALLNRVLSRVD